MNYIFTSNKDLHVNFTDCIFDNIPHKNGLWLPENIPKIDLNLIKDKSFIDIAKIILPQFITDIPLNDLNKIIEKSFTFEPKLHMLNKDNYICELFHGPTLAFKDYGASFMGNLYEYLAKEEINVITATSGDTGGAVASAFYAKKNIKVFILYPKDKVSKLQQKQITSLGKNIFAVEVDGTFDDCQKLVKDTFRNKELKMKIVSANSINIARLLPQTLYYVDLYVKLLNQNINKKIVVSVPSGNLGNLTSGIIAKKMGIPIDLFISSLNENKTFFNFLQNKIFEPKESIATLSSAMDVGNPSNFIRLNYLYEDSEIDKDIISFSFNDEETLAKIKDISQKYNYILDPHTAVGVCGIDKFNNDEYVNVTLATAHPAKFKDEVQNRIELEIDVPERLACLENAKEYKSTIKNSEQDWINLLKEKSSLKENIILIGMAYSGKTTTGNNLAKITNKKQIDTDDVIIEKYGKPLIEILNEHGDEKFLDIEAEAVMSLKEDNLIISTGGSVIYREDAMEFLNKMYGTIYFIDTPIEEIQNRCKNLGSRGVVLKEGQTFKNLYYERLPLYKKYMNKIFDYIYFI